MELRGFEPLTFCMPCRRATSCAIAPQPTTGYSVLEHPARWNAVSIPVPRACVVRDRHASRDPAPAGVPRAPNTPPVTLIHVSTQEPRRAHPAADRDPHQATPTGKPRARALGLKYRGTPGAHNAITDVPGLEVGYRTLIEGDNVRTGVTAIHPRGKGNPGDPVAAGYHSLNGNGEMTGVSWIEESGTCQGPIAITNTHAVGIAHAGIIAWMNQYHAGPHRRLAAPGRGGDLGRLPQRHQRPPRQRGNGHRGAGERDQQTSPTRAQSAAAPA